MNKTRTADLAKRFYSVPERGILVLTYLTEKFFNSTFSDILYIHMSIIFPGGLFNIRTFAYNAVIVF